MQGARVQRLWIGAYPAAGLGSPTGTGEGLWLATMDGNDGLEAHQATVQAAPSFAIAHPNGTVLYAVEESSPTALSVIDARSGAELSRVQVGGDFGCHLALSPLADAIYVSNYGTGDIAVVLIDEQGVPLDDAPQQFLTHRGAGPRSDRQEGSHAHFAGVSPDGKHLLVADLGTDELRRYAIGAHGLLGDAGIAATLPPGSGPRHFAVRGEHIYLVCELDHQMRTLRWDRASATATLIAEQATTLVAHRSGEDVFDGHVFVVHVSSGDVLLASVRGADVISVFDVAPEGELTYRGAVDAGNWPRHFAVAGDRLVVACQHGHEIRSYALADVLGLAPETENGAVATLPYASAPVVSPACIVPLP